VCEKPAQWSVIGQGERLPASSQLYLASKTGGGGGVNTPTFRSC